jgi:hypothetical protein
MNIIEGDYKAGDNKDYYSAVINKEKKHIQIFKNFSCEAKVLDYLEKNYIVSRFDIVGRLIHYYPSRVEVLSIFKIEFLGDSIDLSKISKKYSKFEII